MAYSLVRNTGFRVGVRYFRLQAKVEEKLEKSKIQFIVGSDVGGFIRLRRKQLKVKQEDLAEIAGISERTLRSIEKNKANPTIDTLTKLLDVLGYEIFINLK